MPPEQHKIMRLLHIYLLGKISMKERILDSQLKNGPRAHSNHREKQAKRGNLGHQRKCIIIVRAILLSIPFGNQIGLKHLAIRSHLHYINPTTTNRILARRKSGKLSCAIGVKSTRFLSHCLFPTRVRESITSAFRGRDKKQGGNKGKVG